MSMLDMDAFDSTPLESEPCDYIVVPGFVRPEALPDLNRDYPRIDGPGGFSIDSVSSGPTFRKLVDELHSPQVASRFSEKFGVDLSSLPLQLHVRRFAERSDGNIHNDSRSKFVTALIYFNDEWPQAEGRLRLLRGAQDIDDYKAEVEPVRGTLFAFRRSEHSYHGFLPCEGERRSLQMYWVNPKRGRRGGPKNTPEFFRRFKRLFKTG